MRTATEHALGCAQLGAAPATASSATGSSWQDVLKGLVGAAGQALPIYQQQQLYKMQLDRAARGLAPLPAADVQPAGIPVHIKLDSRLLWMIGGGVLLLGGVVYFATRRRRS